METSQVSRFARLFQGNKRSRGIFHPDTGMAETEAAEPGEDDFREHLEGGRGLGVVPVNDDDQAWFGALDIDTHGEGESISLPEIENKVRGKDLPLVVCRSKSGGAHLYLFCSEPVPAKLVRRALANWSEEIGYSGCEIFPKQNRLTVDSDGYRQRGNWINLPWYDVDNTERYTVEGGKPIRFDYFLELSESRKLSAVDLAERGTDSHAEAPPCMQKMMKSGVAQGHRNEALYNLTTYLKRAFPEDYKDRAFDLNARIFEEPLAHSEASKTIKSAARRDYKYRCKEEPLRGMCQASVCVKRKFGITPDEKQELEMGGQADFQRLVKVNADPARWLLYMDNEALTLTSEDLMDFRRIRIKALEKLSRVLPSMKNDQWQARIHQLLENLEEVDAPEEASAKGIVSAHLSEFLEKTDLNDDGTDRSKRDDLLHGVPVVQTSDTENGTGRYVYFRGPDLVEYLRKQRAEEAKHSNLWMILREIGVTHTKIRVPSKRGPIPVWSMSLDDNDQPAFEERDVGPEY